MTKNEMIAKFLLQYFDCTRGVGHTQTVLKGFNRVPEAMIVVGCAHSLPEISPNYNLPLDDEMPRRMAGRHVPLVFDNHAIYTLLVGYLQDMDDIRSKLNHTIMDTLSMKRQWDEAKEKLCTTQEKLKTTRRKLRAERKRKSL